MKVDALQLILKNIFLKKKRIHAFKVTPSISIVLRGKFVDLYSIVLRKIYRSVFNLGL